MSRNAFACLSHRATKLTAAVLAFACTATLAAADAQAGRPRTIVLDQDALAVTHDSEFETWASLTLMRSPAGEALVVETRPGAPVLVHRLGVQVPASGVEAHYIEAPDGSIFAALCNNEVMTTPFLSDLRVFRIAYDGGDTATHEVGHWYVSDPNSVQLGIIAVLFDGAAGPVQTVSVSFARTTEVAIEEITLAYEAVAGSFVSVMQGAHFFWESERR